jgi:hypothetical protein
VIVRIGIRDRRHTTPDLTRRERRPRRRPGRFVTDVAEREGFSLSPEHKIRNQLQIG